MSRQNEPAEKLPACVIEYIDHVIRKMRYSRSARQEVRQELVDHFTDALAECADEKERQKLAEELIAEFGDAKLLGTLLRRAKKRNRPAWVKFVIRSCQVGAALLALLVGYTAWFIMDRPHPTIDYVSQINEQAKPAIDAGQNAWPLYAEAIKLLVAPDTKRLPDAAERVRDVLPRPSFCELPADQQRLIREWVQENEPAWRLYEAASRKPYFWRVYEVATGDDRGSAVSSDTWSDWCGCILLPYPSPMRHLASVGLWRADIEAADGHPERALQECLAVIRAGRHLDQPNHFMVEQMVGMKMATSACDKIVQIAMTQPLSMDVLAGVQKQLAAMDQSGWPALNVESERMMLVDSIQRTFTDDGLGGGHIIPVYMHTLLTAEAEGYDAKLREQYRHESGWIWLARSAAHARRDNTLRTAGLVVDQLVKWSHMTPQQRHAAGVDPSSVFRQLSPIRYRLVYAVLPPAFRRRSGLDRPYQVQASSAATQTVLALQRYKGDAGQYPESLGPLVPGYMDHLPADPYSNDALRYRRQGDTFILYSLGGDFEDGGGVQTPNDPWADGTQIDHSPSQVSAGDRVFWPAQTATQSPAPHS